MFLGRWREARREVYSEMERLMEQTLADLKSNSYDELKQLPEDASQEVYFRNRKLFVSAWCELRPDDRLAVVVQVGYEYRITMGWTGSTDGFWITPDNRITPFTEEDTWDWD